MDPKKIEEIFKRFKAKNPKPTTELIYHSNFELLIAVILSAQATDVSVNKATEKLFSVANTPEAILALGEEGLKSYIRSINLSNTKAKNVIATCKMLIEKHDSQVPNNREALEELAGVGRKTASVVLNTAFGQPEIAIDTHIFRVANRIGLVEAKNVRHTEDQLKKVIPKKYLHDSHHWLILHGRYTCIARKPRCANCIIHDLCEYPHKTTEAV